jgi:hypothetical protein
VRLAEVGDTRDITCGDGDIMSGSDGRLGERTVEAGRTTGDDVSHHHGGRRDGSAYYRDDVSVSVSVSASGALSVLTPVDLLG